ncbi:MAG: VanZ family protein [Verrucomicrobiota bacterium]|jgi:VanZ family protein
MFLWSVRRRIGKYWLPLILWMCLIFSASTGLGAPAHTSRFVRPFLLWLNPRMSEETIERVHHIVRKCAHFTEYAVLGVLAWRLFHRDAAFSAFSPGRQLWWALLFCAFYASTDEFHQKFVPNRQPAVLDVLLDTCGAGFGVAAAWSQRRAQKTP